MDGQRLLSDKRWRLQNPLRSSQTSPQNIETDDFMCHSKFLFEESIFKIELSPSRNSEMSWEGFEAPCNSFNEFGLAWMSKLWFPCGKLGLQRHVATSWPHVQLEARYKGLTLPGKTPRQRGSCCVHIPGLIQNLPPQLTRLLLICFQNLSVQMGCGYDNRDQGKEGENPQQPSLLHLLLYTSDIAN